MEMERDMEGNQLERRSWCFHSWKELCLSSEGLKQFCSQASVLLMLERGFEGQRRLFSERWRRHKNGNREKAIRNTRRNSAAAHP